MEAYAILRNYPVSPRKVRRVANLIRGLPIARALASLRFQPSPNAAQVEKVLLSAVANWEAKHTDAKTAELYVKEIRVDAGPVIKRYRPAPQGRAHRIRKRSGHVMLRVATMGGETEIADVAVAEESAVANQEATPQATQVIEKKKASKGKKSPSSTSDVADTGTSEESKEA